MKSAKQFIKKGLDLCPQSWIRLTEDGQDIFFVTIFGTDHLQKKTMSGTDHWHNVNVK